LQALESKQISSAAEASSQIPGMDSSVNHKNASSSGINLEIMETLALALIAEVTSYL
jgi:hypothetical protein